MFSHLTQISPHKHNSRERQRLLVKTGQRLLYRQQTQNQLSLPKQHNTGVCTSVSEHTVHCTLLNMELCSRPPPRVHMFTTAVGKGPSGVDRRSMDTCWLFGVVTFLVHSMVFSANPFIEMNGGSKRAVRHGRGLMGDILFRLQGTCGSNRRHADSCEPPVSPHA